MKHYLLLLSFLPLSGNAQDHLLVRAENEVSDYSLSCEYQWLNIITVLFVSCIIWCKVLIYSKLRKCTLFAHLKTCVFFAYIIYLHDISYTRQLESKLSLRSFA